MPISRPLLAGSLLLLICAPPAAAIGQPEPLNADGRFRVQTPRSATGVTLLDRTTGAVERVSADPGGVFLEADHPAIDYAGRHVAFQSWRAQRPDDTNEVGDVYVRDRRCPSPQRVSIGLDGAQGDGVSQLPAISGDGRHVAYISRASNLVPGDTNRSADVFVTDRLTGATERVSLDAQGRQSAGGMGDFGIAPAISADGRHVAFNTRARLTSADTDDGYDVYVRDMQAATLTLASVGTDGGNALQPELSGDGRYVAYTWNGPLSEYEIHRRDLERGATERVAVGRISLGSGVPISISADGSRVAFSDEKTVTVRDLPAGTTVTRTGTSTRYTAELSADGRFVSWAQWDALGGVSEVGGALPVPAVTAFDPPCTEPEPTPSAYRSAVLADGPSGYWRFDELPGAAVARDEAGPPHGELHAPAGVPGALTGDPGTAITLGGDPQAGSGHYAAFDHEPALDGRAPFSLEAWIRPRGLNGHTRRVFSSEGRTGGWLLGVRDTGLYFGRHASGRWNTAHAPLAAGRWSHVVATFDGATMRLFVDGEQLAVQDAPLATPPVEAAEPQLVVGSLRGRWKFFAGEIDEAAVYPRALPAARVAAHFALGRAM